MYLAGAAAAYHYMLDPSLIVVGLAAGGMLPEYLCFAALRSLGADGDSVPLKSAPLPFPEPDIFCLRPLANRP